MTGAQTSNWYNPAVSQGLRSPNYCWGTNSRKPSGPAAICCINRPDTWMQVTYANQHTNLLLPIGVRPYMGHRYTVAAKPTFQQRQRLGHSCQRPRLFDDRNT